MKKQNHIEAALLFCAVSILISAIAHTESAKAATPLKPVIMASQVAKMVGAQIDYEDVKTGLVTARIDAQQEQRAQEWSHSLGHCGSFESLESLEPFATRIARASEHPQLFTRLHQQENENQKYLSIPFRPASLTWSQDIQNAIDQVNPKEVQNLVQWISSFPTRYNRGANANVPVDALVAKLNQMIAGSKLPVKVDTIAHKSTQQKSVRVHIDGFDRPSEIIVFGAHFDSISNPSDQAPGADDNASGSANLLEALRIILMQAQPERSLEFFWYAGEESGLLGSAEIAESYMNAQKDVVAVLQLDMTLYPGEGQFVIGNVEDYTSSWLWDYFRSMAQVYLKARLVSDQCGYACSDHASWYRRGYSTLLPFEATTNTMNHNLHTIRDVINSKSDFQHSTVFARIPVVMAMDLGNSTNRKPF